MPIVSSKRQITLPIEACNELDIKAGDEVEVFVYRGQLNIIKKTKGIAASVLKDLKVENSITEDGSRLSHFE